MKNGHTKTKVLVFSLLNSISDFNRKIEFIKTLLLFLTKMLSGVWYNLPGGCRWMMLTLLSILLAWPDFFFIPINVELLIKCYSLLVTYWFFVGVKPFKCSLCEYATRSKSNLKAHMNRHSTEKTHLCDMCGKKFKSKGTLKSHKILHTANGKCMSIKSKFILGQ